MGIIYTNLFSRSGQTDDSLLSTEEPGEGYQDSFLISPDFNGAMFDTMLGLEWKDMKVPSVYRRYEITCPEQCLF